MRQPSPIADYLDRLARELSFDQALSRRVRAEVEDHLWEAATNESREPSPEVQHQIILNFGDCRELAREYVAASLLAQLRRVAAIMVSAVIGIFVAMKGRIAWYGLVKWESNPDWSTANAIGLLLDRYAFMIALCVALIGCGYIATREVPVRFHRGYDKQLNRCLVLCGAAAGALLFVVGTEIVLTSIRLSGGGWRVAAFIPALSLAAELAVASAFIMHIRATVRRKAAASPFLQS